MRRTPQTEIVPLGPETARVALYVDGELVGEALSARAGRATLAALADEILAETRRPLRRPRPPRRWPRHKPVWRVPVVGADVADSE